MCNFVLVRLRKTDPYAKLMSRGTGPWRVFLDDREHVHEVQQRATPVWCTCCFTRTSNWR